MVAILGPQRNPMGAKLFFKLSAEEAGVTGALVNTSNILCLICNNTTMGKFTPDTCKYIAHNVYATYITYITWKWTNGSIWTHNTVK